MRTVPMPQLTSATDAYRAAFATLMELELDDVPVFTGMAAPMQYDGWMAGSLNLTMLRCPAGVIAPMGLWLARLPSPYLGYDVHTVVMQGTSTAWDPHPEGRLMTEEFTISQVELVVPLDPAQPIGAEALHRSP